jgi:hypothetical protein
MVKDTQHPISKHANMPSLSQIVVGGKQGTETIGVGQMEIQGSNPPMDHESLGAPAGEPRPSYDPNGSMYISPTGMKKVVQEHGHEL